MKRYSESDWAELEEKLRGQLSGRRFRHTLGVTYTSCALAMRWGADLDKARLAGLLHDCAKCIQDEEKIRVCRKHRVDVTDFEIAHPALLHAKLGPYIAEKEYGVHDPEVLDAVRWHTTGRPEMSLLEMIVYTADYIEPHRDKAPHLVTLRPLAFTDLEQCVEQILSDTVEYLSKDPDATDPMTAEAAAYYCRKTGGGRPHERTNRT